VLNPVVVAAIGLAAAALAAPLGRSFLKYGEGKPSYVGNLEGRYFLAAILMILLAAVGSAVLAFLIDGSLARFWWIFLAFLIWGLVVFTFLFARSRK